MNNLLNKFKDIKVENVDRIGENDKGFCETTQHDYKIAIASILSCLDELKKTTGVNVFEKDCYNTESKNEFIGWYEMKDIKVLADKIQKGFINKILRYFDKTYNVNIEIENINKKYDYTVTYENLLDDIFVFLGGNTFDERAVNELKEATRKTYYFNQYTGSNITMKNNKLSIDGRYSYFDSIWKENKLSGDFNKIFTALYYFDSKVMTKNNSELYSKYCGYSNEKNEANYEKYIPQSLTKVKSIKFFKNGKLQIEFQTAQQALLFAKDYCGYIERIDNK